MGAFLAQRASRSHRQEATSPIPPCCNLCIPRCMRTLRGSKGLDIRKVEMRQKKVVDRQENVSRAAYTRKKIGEACWYRQGLRTR
jgi:hypothetical protein